MTKRSRLTIACSIGLAAFTAAGLAGCTSVAQEELAAHAQMPTLAPDQSIAEACKISSTQVDQLVLTFEEQINNGISAATASALNGEWPSWDFLTTESSISLEEIGAAVINPEVSAAIDRVVVQLDEFSSVEPPANSLGVPSYLATLGNELNQLSKAGTDLAQLCSAAPAGHTAG